MQPSTGHVHPDNAGFTQNFCACVFKFYNKRKSTLTLKAVSSKASLDWIQHSRGPARVMWPNTITNTAQIYTHNRVYRRMRIKGADFTVNHTLRLYYYSQISQYTSWFIYNQVKILQECFICAVTEY